MEITVDTKQLAALKKAIEGTSRSLLKEYAIAINQTAKACQGIMAKQVATQIKVKQAVVKSQTRVGRKASQTDLGTTVTIKPTARISLKEFGARQTKSGVTYQISKRGKRGRIPSGFIVSSLGGHAYQRRGKSRKPIDKLHGPSPWGLFVKGNAKPPTVEATQAELAKQIARRIKAITFKKSQGA